MEAKTAPNREVGLSEQGRHFLGGIMKHASALAAITNPTVNSYKRINRTRTTSGATWAPNTVTWTGNNRTHMVRVPGPGRFELAPARRRGEPLSVAGDDHRGRSVWCALQSRSGQASRHRHVCRRSQSDSGAPKLPLNMLDALREYDEDEGLKAAMGEEFSAAYLKMKMQEWDSFVSYFSQWEKDNTLDI